MSERHTSRRIGLVVMAVVTAVVIVTGVLWYAPVTARGAPPSLRVLFIGNSFTSTNDLPLVVSRVASSLGDRVDYDVSAPGGSTLAQHLSDPSTLAKIDAEPWNDVVLQEQSELRTFPSSEEDQQSTPYAVQLVDLIRRHDPATEVIFFETWGYEGGDQSNCPVLPEVCSYSSMQEQLRESYGRLADLTDSSEALVGEAWKQSQARYPQIDLYSSDGKHPSAQGTYLAACVFYQALFGRSPVGAAHPSVSSAAATALQSVAAAQ
jgi:hypothetical protein